MATTHDVETQMLQRDIEETKASLERNVGTLAGEIRSTLQRAAPAKESVYSGIDRAMTISGAIRAHPYRAILVAVAGGLIVGRVWGRFRRYRVRNPRPRGRLRLPTVLGLMEPELAAVRARAMQLVLDGIRSFLRNRAMR